MILGNNGYVWISPLDDEEATLTDGQTERVVTEDKPPKQVDIDYLTIRWRAQGFYRLIVGEGQSPQSTIKGDRNRERAVLLFLHTSVIDL